ncbi:response regulator [Erysipelothrix urinaevulpis]|uniref:response regulator transcription factor n=1 Tax=Erysipelothrix urinaevulpis TaxID=2683717 RepID=UPI00135AFAEB|nr:response regulator [Erysipelothrix urinaevulpis]
MLYKVCIVEDEAIIRKGLIRSIDWEKESLELVGEASNGKEALTTIANTYPDIILLDINMPIMDGIELLKALPENTYSIVILSGHSEFKYAQQAIKFGVVDYLLKPIEKEQLSRTLDKAKQRSDKLKNLTQPKEDRYQILSKVDKTVSITLSKSLQHIEENYQAKITLEDLVEVTDKSTTSINSRFQQHLNMTFNEYLTLFRIQKSIDLIKLHEYRMYEIAEMVGYNDYKYFNQVFSKVVGVPPKIVKMYYSTGK